jgi:hypothetical protein
MLRARVHPALSRAVRQQVLVNLLSRQLLRSIQTHVESPWRLASLDFASDQAGQPLLFIQIHSDYWLQLMLQEPRVVEKEPARGK